jgi:hypothetical protein
VISGGLSAAPTAEGQCTIDFNAEALPGLDGTPHAVAAYDDGSGPALFVGGSFKIAGDVFATNIAKWDGQNWLAVGGGTNGFVSALAVYDGELVAAGGFTSAGGVSVNRIARWDGMNWRPLGSGVTGHTGLGDPFIADVAAYNGELVAGGIFTSAGGIPVNHIARWNGTTWQALGTGVTGPNTPPFVRALGVFNGELIAGGPFTTAGGIAANHIARWNGVSWSPMGSGISGNVEALREHGGELIVGGNFSNAGGVDAKHVARWNGDSLTVSGAI